MCSVDLIGLARRGGIKQNRTAHKFFRKKEIRIMKGKKLLAGVLSAAMVLGTMALPAFADDSTAIVSTTEELETALANSTVTEITISGTIDTQGVDFSNVDGITIKGDLSDGADILKFSGAYKTISITFSDVTLEWPNANYQGLQHSTKLTYNNCTIKGQPFLYAKDEIFNDCTFIQESSDAYNVWTYGAENVEFNNCKFKSAGKSVLVYNEGALTSGSVNVENCTFNASASVEGKAAIEIDSTYSNYSVDIDDKTAATGFAAGSTSGSSLYNVKKYQVVTGADNSKKLNTEIKVNGETVMPLSDEKQAEEFGSCVAKVDDKYFATLKDAFTAACNMNVADVDGIPTQTAPVTVDLIADIENQEEFSAYGGAIQNGYGWHFVHNVDITLNGNGHKIDTGRHGSNHADNNKSPNINVSSNNGKFTVKNVIAPNDLLFTVTKPGHATSDCKDEARAESLVVENCEFYGSNIGYDSTVNTVMYKNNKFLLTENENDHPDAYPLWYKFDWAIKKFTFEGNTVKSQRALNLARFSENCEIDINNNDFAVENSETPAKSAAIMLAENHTDQHPYNGNLTFNGNAVDAHSAVLVYTPSEYNTNFDLTAESNVLANGTKLVGYNEWSGSYTGNEAAKAAAKALVKKVENKANGSEDVADTIGLKFNKHADDETVYDIVLSGEGKDINRLNAAEFKFDLSTTKMTYDIKAADGMALIPQEDGKYEFHFDGKDAIGGADSGAEIVIGTVTFDGYDTFTFKATAGRATATTTSDNLVSEFVVGGAGGKGTLNIDGDDNKIEDEIKVPTQVLTINVLTNHNVGNNVAAYQDMTVAISGGNLAGNVLTYKLGNDNSDVTVATNVNGDVTSYQIKTELDQNKLYTVNVSGAGYRTARYTATMNADKTLSVWNNVMSNEVTVVDDTKATTNFLAGDIVKDNSINIYDLSAVVAYFGTEMATNEYNKYAKYDLNRDGKIDIMDISMVLTSWGK